MVVRCRPMSRKETEDSRQKVVEMDKHRGCVRDRCLWRPCVHASPRVLVVWQVILHNAGGSGEPPKTFTFDQVYDDTSQQEVTHTRTHGRSHRNHRNHRSRPGSGSGSGSVLGPGPGLGWWPALGLRSG